MSGGPDNDRMLRHGLLLLAANGVVAVLNLLFQVVAARTLSDSEYAVLVAFLEAVVLLAVPTAGLSTAITHYTVRQLDGGHEVAIWRMACRWFLRMTLLSVVVLVVAVWWRDPLAAVFRFDRGSAVVAAGLAVAAALMLPVWSAVLAGLQRFTLLSGYLVAVSAHRVLLAWLLMGLFYPVAGYALLGHALAHFIGLGICATGVWYWTRRRRPPVAAAPAAPVGRFVLESFIFLLALRLLTLADVNVARQLFEPAEAEYYARLSVTARLVMMVVLPLANVMLPKVVPTGANGAPARRQTAWRAGLLSVVLILPVVGGLLAFPDLVYGLIHGKTDLAPEARLTLRWLAVAMLPMAAMNLLAQYGIAGRQWLRLWVLPPAALVLLVWAGFRVETPVEWAQCLFAVNTIAVILVLLFRGSGQTGQQPAVVGEPTGRHAGAEL